MMQFRYRAVDGQANIVNGIQRADNAPDLEARLSRIGLMLISMSETRPGLLQSLRRGGISRRDLIDFFYHMESLLRAGVPILEALADLRDSSENESLASLVADVVERIETGSTFSDALSGHPEHFSTLLVGLVRAGEVTGKLPDVLAEITASLKWQDELAAQTKKALMYPSFVASAVFGAVFFLMIYLVPQLVTFLANMGEELPLPTRVLIAVSELFVNFWPLLIAVPVTVAMITTTLVRRSPVWRRRRDGLLLHLPVIGPILRRIAVARFANTLALMYGAGITVLDGFRHCEEAVGNLVIAEGIARARTLITQGIPISEALEATALFPPLVIRMVKVGEQTGNLDTALRNVGYFFSRDITDAIGRLQALIEPALTVVLGAILGWIMIAVLGPIYDTISRIPM